MIVFSIAFGEAYIRRLFDRCLPSLMSANNFPRLKNELKELAIFTLDNDVPLLQQILRKQHALSDVFSKTINIYPFKTSGLSELPDGTPRWQVNSNILYHLLCRAVHHCIDADDSFFFAVPDLVYSDGLYQQCSQLHTLTGKVVMTFNGRVSPQNGKSSFSHEELLSAAANPISLRDFFFGNLSREWCKWLTFDPRMVSDAHPGKQVFFSDLGTYVFFDTPNPTCGRFTIDDLIFISESRLGIQVWDRLWRVYLLRHGRGLIQPCLDNFLSIEPGEADWDPRIITSEENSLVSPRNTYTARLGLDQSEAARRSKFSYEGGHFPFTSSYIKGR